MVDLASLGIQESELDFRWRLLISCLKCEYDTYQAVLLEKTITHYLDDEIGRAAWEKDEGHLEIEELTKVSYFFANDNAFDLQYNDLIRFQKQLDELFQLLRVDSSWIISDRTELEEGVLYVEKEGAFPDIPEVFEITLRNVATLQKLLDELDLDEEFWIAAGEAMQGTLKRQACEHDWDEDICQTCGAFRFLEEY